MKRKSASFLLAFILIAPLITACSREKTPSTGGGGKLTIIHINDTHGRTAAEPYISRMAKNLRAKGENVLILDAGDRLHGQTAVNLTKGETMVEVMNAVGYSAMVSGNHEYNFGIDRLKELSAIMNFPLLAANVRYNGNYIFERYRVFKMDGFVVGVFGLVTPETVTSSDPRNMAGLVFENPVQIAADMAGALKAESCDVIIALTHLGNDHPTAENERSDAVAAVDGIDIVIDGHSHTLLENGELIGKTLIAQTGEHARHIGIVEIMLDNGEMTKTARLIAVPNADGEETELPRDNAVVIKIDEGESTVKSITDVVVGASPVTLDGKRESVRTGETNLANLITNSMIHATGACISFIGGGSIRSGIESGDITMGDVLTVLPFSNLIVTVELKGSDVLEIFEHGVSQYPEPAGQYIQVGGARFTFNPSAKPMSRITEAYLINGKGSESEIIQADRIYTVATIDFIAAGGDGYTMMEKGGNLKYYQGDAEAFVSYLETKPAITAEPEGRVKPQ